MSNARRSVPDDARPPGGAAASSTGEDVAAGGVQSVDRAISVLEILARRGEAGVTEVAEEISVHKSTAFRLLGALEGRGLVKQAEDRGKYRLGFGIMRLAGAVAAQMDVTSQGRPICERLARDIGETVNLAVAQGAYAVNVDQVRGPAAVTAQNWVGQLTPLHATSSGKILLAHMAEPRWREIVAAQPLESFTPSTVTTVDALEQHLQAARRLGYATAIEEYEVGLTAVAAPIRSHRGEVVAAVSASGPAYRFTAARLHEIAPVLVAGADEISHRLGYLG